MNALNLSPLFQTTVGFDRFARILDNALDADLPSYPPYNIEAIDENRYVITMALAGFKESDISVDVKENRLTVKGAVLRNAQKPAQDDPKRRFLYKGIANRSFEHSFNLAEYVQVEKAEMADGLLYIALHREVPERLKSRAIPIARKK